MNHDKLNSLFIFFMKMYDKTIYLLLYSVNNYSRQFYCAFHRIVVGMKSAALSQFSYFSICKLVQNCILKLNSSTKNVRWEFALYFFNINILPLFSEFSWELAILIRVLAARWNLPLDERLNSLKLILSRRWLTRDKQLIYSFIFHWTLNFWQRDQVFSL